MNTFKSIIDDIPQAGADIYTVPVDTTTVVIGMRIGNKTASDETVNVVVFKAIEFAEFISLNTPIPAGAALEGVQGAKLVLNYGDKLHASASADAALTITLSVMEITP